MNTSGSMTGAPAMPQDAAATAQQVASFKLGNLTINGLPQQAVSELNAEIQRHISQLQSTYDRNFDQMRRQMEAYQLQLEEQVFQNQLAGMTAEEQQYAWAQRQQHAVSEREQQLAQREQQLSRQERVATELANLSQRSGVPVEVLRQQGSMQNALLFAGQQMAARQLMQQVPPSQMQNPAVPTQAGPAIGRNIRPGSPEWSQMWEDMKNGRFG
jgi:hypothetical protein